MADNIDNPEAFTEDQAPEENTDNGKSEQTLEESKPNENGDAEVKADIKGDETKTSNEDKSLEEDGLINATEDNESKMFVGGLSWDTETFSLRDYFSKYGENKDCIIKKDSKTERSRGFGFVLFADLSSVRKVMEVSAHYLHGRKIDSKRAQAQRKDGKMFVSGVKSDTDDEKIKEYFSKFEDIELFERPKDKATGKARGFCFITFKKDGVLKKCCAEKTHEVDGASVEVKKCQNFDKSRMGRGKRFMVRGGGWIGAGMALQTTEGAVMTLVKDMAIIWAIIRDMAVGSVELWWSRLR